ncbi:hypothetical protein ACT2FY_00450 [Paraburkholderia fungorum]|uniref:hypothetical protein n=1 Tax=Paraburkholderia fungorum TaxID=134537 RepID=UPI00402B3CA1
MPTWLQIIIGVAAPLIAGAGVFVAYQQWLVGQRSLKHDLFDRRWNVYAATNDVIAAHLNGKAEDASERLQEFLRRKMDAAFLLPASTNAFLGDVLTAVEEYRSARRKLAATPADKLERGNVEASVLQTEEALKALHTRLVEVFRKPLDLSK